MNEDLPEEFQDLPRVEIPEQRVTMEAGDRAETAKQLGMMTVSRDVISTLERIGLDIEDLGVVKVANGFCFLSQQAVLLCISKISEAVQNGADVKDIAAAMAKLANSMTNSVKAMKLGGWQKAQPQQKQPIDIGFTPGRRIKHDPKPSK